MDIGCDYSPCIAPMSSGIPEMLTVVQMEVDKVLQKQCCPPYVGDMGEAFSRLRSFMLIASFQI